MIHLNDYLKLLFYFIIMEVPNASFLCIYFCKKIILDFSIGEILLNDQIKLLSYSMMEGPNISGLCFLQENHIGFLKWQDTIE